MHTYHRNDAGGLAMLPNKLHDEEVAAALSHYSSLDFSEYGDEIKRKEVLNLLAIVPVVKKGELCATEDDEMCVYPHCLRFKHMLHSNYVSTYPLCYAHHRKIKLLVDTHFCTERQAIRWGLMKKK